MKVKKTIVIGISSGIAAYKMIELVKILQEEKFDVQVIMTKNARFMMPPAEFEKVLNHKVYLDLFPKGFDYRKVLKIREVEHIQLADKASLFVIAPATANIIGKIAAGFADDFLTTALLATTSPVLICPSMNPHMWSNSLVQENIKKLKQLGYHILTPGKGSLACGYDGVGRLPEIKLIAAEIYKILKQRDRLKGKKIIVTAGGTIEHIDPVRVITNKSSGKMGLSLAETSYFQGAEVLLLRAKNSVSSDYPIAEKIFTTGKDLQNLIKKHCKNYDVLFHAAAVSDFIPQKHFNQKIESNKPLTLTFHPAVKILQQIKIWNPKIKLIGFKAVYKETEENLLKKGRDKLKESNADYIIVNDVGKKGVGFEVDTNEVYILSAKGSVAKVEKAPKSIVAQKIINSIFN